MVGSQPINGSDKSSSLVLWANLERPTMSDNMTINRLRFGFHRSDNRFQNSVPVLALLFTPYYIRKCPHQIIVVQVLCLLPTCTFTGKVEHQIFIQVLNYIGAPSMPYLLFPNAQEDLYGSYSYKSQEITTQRLLAIGHHTPHEWKFVCPAVHLCGGVFVVFSHC